MKTPREIFFHARGEREPLMPLSPLKKGGMDSLCA
jgi:hypothetical protein